MHSTYQITGNDLAKALIGLTKPAKKAKSTIHSDAFNSAHVKVNAIIAFERSRPSGRNWKPTAAERRRMFGSALKDAYAWIRVERRDAPVPHEITLDECLTIGSDSRFSDRRGV